MVKLTKKHVSQDPSDKYFEILKDVFDNSDIPSTRDSLDKRLFMPVSIVVRRGLGEDDEELKAEVIKKISNLVFFQDASIENDKETVSIEIKGYMEKFNPIKYMFYTKKTLQDKVYASHKVDITIEEDEIETKIVMHSYTRDFAAILDLSINRIIDKFDTIKEYEVKQNKNSLDCFEIIIRGKKKDDRSGNDDKGTVSS